jgi:hypothetical protein
MCALKDLVEHIRTVHFTLLVVCLVLLATSFEEKKRPLVRADEDARAVEELSREKDAVLDRINDAAANAASAAGAVSKETWFGFVEPTSWPVTGRAGIIQQPVSVFFKNSSSFVYFASLRQESGADHVGLWSLSNGADMVDPSAQWRTLADFVAFWDQEHVFYSLPALHSGDQPPACPTAAALSGPPSVVLVQGNLQFVRIGANSLVPTITAQGRTCSFARQPGRDLGINVRTMLKKALPYDVPWNSSASSSAFPELLNAAKGLEELPLSNLVEQLDARVNADTEKVELFQTKIPAAQIAVFGSIMLCACEFYLLLHLRELSRVMTNKGSEEIPEGYVGLYKDRLSQIFTLLSVAAFPGGCLVLTAIKARSESRIGFSVAIGSSIFSAVVSVFTCKEFYRIRTISTPVELGSDTVAGEDC